MYLILVVNFLLVLLYFIDIIKISLYKPELMFSFDPSIILTCKHAQKSEYNTNYYYNAKIT